MAAASLVQQYRLPPWFMLMLLTLLYTLLLRFLVLGWVFSLVGCLQAEFSNIYYWYYSE